MKKKTFFPALLLALTLCLTLALPVAAAKIPAAPANVYVDDEAGVLDAATEDDFIRRGEALFALTGAQIVTVTIRDSDITDLEQFSYDVFNSWGIGSKERNNGVLFVLNTETEDYYASAGYGIEDILTTDWFYSHALDPYVEPKFAAGDYDGAARAFFNAVLAKLEDYYNASVDKWDGNSYLYRETGGGAPSGASTGIAEIFGTAVIIILVVGVFIVFCIARSMFRPRFYGSYYRPRPFFGPFFFGPGPHYGPRPGPGPHHPGGFGGGSSFGGGHSGGSSFGGGGHSFGGGGSHGGGAGRH